MHANATRPSLVLVAPFVAVVALVGVVAVLPACDLFGGGIACTDDGDCPSDVKFCVAGKCSADDGGGRNGRGVDGGCASDADCADGNGLCDIDGKFGTAGACLPPEDDATADCSANPDVVGDGPTPVRDAAGPVIFDVQVESQGDGCYFNTTFTIFQREPQPITNGFIELVVGGANLTQSGPGSGSDDTTIHVDSMCGAQFGKVPGLLFDLGGKSNVACLPAPQ